MNSTWQISLDDKFEYFVGKKAYIQDEEIAFITKFSKHSSNLEFDIKDYETYRDSNNICITIYRNLKNNPFLKKCFDIDYTTNDMVDMYTCILKQNYFNKVIHVSSGSSYTGLSVDFNTGFNSTVNFSDYLSVSCYRPSILKDNYYMYVFNNKRYNRSINKNVNRTAAIEITTNKNKEIVYNTFGGR